MKSFFFFLTFFLFCSCSPAASRGQAPRYSRAPFSDFYRCRSQIRKREMRHLVSADPRKDFHSIQSIAESKWNCPFFSSSSYFSLFLSFFLFRDVYTNWLLFVGRVVRLSVLFSERNRSTLAMLSCTPGAQSIRQRPRWQVPSTRSRLRSYHVYT